ncbi:MAG: DUF2007 domain-containing protein [Candidatus Neomarinimicrobiota bacterium]
MPFCPHCLYEFVEGTKTCADCKAKLVDQLPAEKLDAVKWLFLVTLSDITIAEMVKEALNNNGIPVFLKTDPIHSALSVFSAGATGSYARLYVPRGQKEAALEILQSMTDTH